MPVELGVPARTLRRSLGAARAPAMAETAMKMEEMDTMIMIDDFFCARWSESIVAPLYYCFHAK